MKTSLFIKIGLSTAILTLSGLLLPLSGSAGSVGDQPAVGDYSRGAKVWSNNCGRCHNIRDARELRDDQWFSTAFHMRIRGGLTGQETRDTIAFLTASNKPARKSIITVKAPISSGTGKSDGQVTYNKTCIACHGGNGKGTLPGAPDFTNPKGALSKSDAVLIKHITEGFQSPGSPMAMPAKGGNTDLTVEDMRAVLAYLRKQFGK
ncbi:MAG TPA: c-type cytochrome [Acidiferrobacteraceae bacterium]|nr:c-type cytochrome [Acidiferrobacteraceae bacterium]